MTWMKQPVWAGPVYMGCVHCSPMVENGHFCQLDRLLAVGFGDVTVTKDEETLYSECTFMQAHEPSDPGGMDDDAFGEELMDSGENMVDYPTLATYEEQAASDPDHDWRVRFYGPLHEETYQRQGPEAWVLIHSGMGFA